MNQEKGQGWVPWLDVLFCLGALFFWFSVLRNCNVYFWFLYLANLKLQAVKQRRSRVKMHNGVGSSWPDRCCAPSRTVLAQEARDGLFNGVWSAYLKAKIIRLYKPFWSHEELRWVKQVVPRPPVPRAARNLNRPVPRRVHRRVAGNRRRLRRWNALSLRRQQG